MSLPPAPTAAAVDDASTIILSSAVAAIATIAPTIGIDIPTITQSIAEAVATGGGEDGPHGPPPDGECRLLGPFAIIVQGALGLLALSSLVFKRWRERPQRPIKIWAFDASKQVVGSVLVHIANLLMSMLSSGRFSRHPDPASIQTRMDNPEDHYRPNPCSYYLLNLAIDTTVGIPILIVILRVLTALFSMTPLGNPPESLQSGNYGTPPRAYWWFKQSILYFFGLLGMKFCVLIIFLVLPWISRVGDWALSWTEGNEQLQVFFVMLLFPLIMNAAQYYIIDSFIKNQKPEHEPIEAADPEAGREAGDEDAGSEDNIIMRDEEDLPEGLKSTDAWRTKSDEDGTTAVESGSSSERGQLLHDDEVDSEDESKPLRK